VTKFVRVRKITIDTVSKLMTCSCGDVSKMKMPCVHSLAVLMKHALAVSETSFSYIQIVLTHLTTNGMRRLFLVMCISGGGVYSDTTM